MKREDPMTIVIHHNPDCGTSRNVLEIIRASGTEPVVRIYAESSSEAETERLITAAKRYVLEG